MNFNKMSFDETFYPHELVEMYLLINKKSWNILACDLRHTGKLTFQNKNLRNLVSMLVILMLRGVFT